MNRRKENETITAYLNFLNDIYNGAINERQLIVKHKIGTVVYHAVKKAGFVNEQGFSIMKRMPTIKDAEKLRNARLQCEKMKTTRVKRAYKKRKIAEPKINLGQKGREISILWGMIKIKS